MESIPDGFVSIQVFMPPEVLADLFSAARRADMPLEEWLTRLLAIGTSRPVVGRSV